MKFLWRWAPVIAQMAAIFSASSMTSVPDLPGGLSDKTGHMIGYALLSSLAVRAFAGARWDGVNAASAVRAVLLAVLYGVTDEFHQMFVANRSSDIHDWFADIGGAILGALLCLAAARVVLQLRQRSR